MNPAIITNKLTIIIDIVLFFVICKPFRYLSSSPHYFTTPSLPYKNYLTIAIVATELIISAEIKENCFRLS